MQLIEAHAWFFININHLLFLSNESISERFGEIETAGTGLGGKEDIGFFTVFKDIIEQGGTIVLVAVSGIAFMWIAYSAVMKFRECQSGRADWAELIVLGVAGGAVLVFVALLLSDASRLLGLQ